MLVVLGSLCTEQQTIGLPHLPSRGAFCTYSIRLAENLQGGCRDLAHARVDTLNIKIQDLKGQLAIWRSHAILSTQNSQLDLPLHPTS